VFPYVVKAVLSAAPNTARAHAARRQDHRLLQAFVCRLLWLASRGASLRFTHVFMNDAAIASLNSAKGLEVVSDPTSWCWMNGMAKKATTTTLRDDIYAFVFGQQGLMAGLGIQGSKLPYQSLIRIII